MSRVQSPSPTPTLLSTINQIHFVFLKRAIWGEQRPFCDCLGNQHAVKRVPVMPRRFTGAEGVFVGDIQCAYCPYPKRTRNVFRRRLRKIQSAWRVFDRNFPGPCGGKIQIRRRAFQNFLRAGVELFFGHEAPRGRRLCPSRTSCVLFGFSDALFLAAFEKIKPSFHCSTAGQQPSRAPSCAQQLSAPCSSFRILRVFAYHEP